MNKKPFLKARLLIAGGIFILLVVSLLFNTGTGTLSALGIDSLVALCPLGGLEVLLSEKSLLPRPLILLLVIGGIVILLGKAFCSWACPVPWVQKLFRRDKASDKVKTPPDSKSCSGGCKTCSLEAVGGRRDGFRLDTRHVTLVGVLASSALFGFPVFCLVCPVGLTFAVLIGVWNLFQFGEASWGLLIFPAMLILELVVFRKWCHKICPISALLSLLSQGKSFLRPVVKQDVCLRESGTDCTVCVDTCPEHVDPHSLRIPECSKCGRCVEECPANAIDMNFKSPVQRMTKNGLLKKG